jgi:hypothetical protein
MPSTESMKKFIQDQASDYRLNFYTMIEKMMSYISEQERKLVQIEIDEIENEIAMNKLKENSE